MHSVPGRVGRRQHVKINAMRGWGLAPTGWSLAHVGGRPGGWRFASMLDRTHLNINLGTPAHDGGRAIDVM